MLKISAIIVTQDSSFSSRVTSALREDHEGTESSAFKVVAHASVHPAEEFGETVTESTIIIVDWSDAADAGGQLSPTQELLSVVEERLPLTVAGTLLRHLRESFRERMPMNRPIIVLCANSPSVAVTQVALRLGANWVWPSRSAFAGLGAVCSRLVELAKLHPQNVFPKKRIFVLENDSVMRQRLSQKLKPKFDLEFVDDDGKTERELIDISLEDAVTAYGRHKPFDAVIADLAIDQEGEGTAARQVESTEANFALMMPEALSLSMKGIQFVKTIFDRGDRLPVAIFSNFVDSAHTQSQIKLILGDDVFMHVRIFNKTDRQFRTLIDFLNTTVRTDELE